MLVYYLFMVFKVRTQPPFPPGGGGWGGVAKEGREEVTPGYQFLVFLRASCIFLGSQDL